VRLSQRTAVLRPGTILAREWNGQMQRVAVLADGFAWNGNTYPSLSDGTRRSKTRATLIGCVLKRFTRNSKESTMSPMSEHDQSRKFADKTATIANETLEKGKAAAEQSAQAVEKSYSVTVENMRTLNVKMIEMARTNAEAAFDLALQIAKVQTPSDITGVWTTHARKQFEILGEQTKELTALGQKMAGEGVAPIVRGVSEVFKKAS